MVYKLRKYIEYKEVEPKRPTPRNSISKMAKLEDKDTILKAAREKQSVTYKKFSIRISADLSK